MKHTIPVVIASLLVISCAGVQVQRDLHNPRIIYRDLTKPIPTAESETPAVQEFKISEPPVKEVSTPPIHFIEFGNDSYQSFDKKSASAFADATPSDATILVLGHSHGKSAVGTLKLATRRAESVARYLRGRGYEKIHVMAAWGGQTVEFSPNRGVQLYVLDPGKAGEPVSIAFSKEIQKGKFDEGINLADTRRKMADSRRTKTDLEDAENLAHHRGVNDADVVRAVGKRNDAERDA